MPSATTPSRPRPLSKTHLSAALSAAKPLHFSEHPTSTTSAPPRRGAALGPSSSAAFAASTPSSTSASAIRTLAWSPTGAHLATADPRVLRVWNPERPGVKYSTELKPGGTAAAGGPAGGSNGGGASGRAPPQQHLAGTERVAWNPTREGELASVGADGVVRFWDVRARGACVGEVKVGGEGFSLAWRPDGSEVVVGRKDDTLIPISRAGLAVLAQYPQPVQTNQIAFTNGGNELLLTTGDSQVKIVDYPSMTPLHTLTAHTSSCYTVTPSPSGRHLAIGGSDALITLWSTSDFTCRHTLPEMGGPVRSLSFSFDGSYLVGGSDEVAAVGAGMTAGGADAAAAAAGGTAGAGGGAGAGLQIAHAETGEYVHTVETRGPAACVQWHPARYVLAWGDALGLRVLGVPGV